MTAPGAATFPDRIGRYELLDRLGAGGMATVYLARSEGPNGFARTVALKLMHAHLREDPELVTSLMEEAKLAALIHHPNVATVIDAGDDDAGPFLVMDYVEGDSLHALQKRGPIPLPVGLRVVDDALAGLHAAHELKSESGAALGLVHRDFSPHNLLIGVDGVTRLLDFGVAKAVSREGRTRTGVIKGKVRYMAPEQVRGEPLDRRCDVWAAGVVAWEVLAGRRLYADEDDIAIAMKIVAADPPSLRDVCPEVAPELAEAVASALVVRHADRCPTAAELRRRLDRAAQGAGGLATTGEVGDFVFRAAGDAIRERTQRAAALREARAAAPVAAAAPATSTSTSTSTKRAGVAAVAVAIGAALTAAVVARRPVPTPASAAASTEAPPASQAPPVVPPIEPAAAAETAGIAAMLTVSANLPIQSLQIGERSLTFPHPARSIVVQLTADEHAAALELRAFSTDGRSVTASADAGATETTFAFPVARRAAPKPPTSAVPRSSTSAPSLIKNPYR
jgi:serine/threonine-protein kinase